MNIFNDPNLILARKAVPEEMANRLKAYGEALYKDVDFETETINHVITNALFEIEMALKSGLDPVDLTNDEIAVLDSEYGAQWRETYARE